MKRGYKNMQLTNREGYEKFNIPTDWDRDRWWGISAMIRCYNEEDWIGQCIESILPFFDEIVVTYSGNDRTKKIISNIGSPKVKVFHYPFKIKNSNGTCYDNSVHGNAYYYNWTMSKTTYKMVSKWDADMILLPWFYKIKEKILSKNHVWCTGYNVLNLHPVTLSNIKTCNREIRFAKISPLFYYILYTRKYNIRKKWRTKEFQVCKADRPFYRLWYNKPRVFVNRLYNKITQKDVHIVKPVFIHTKFLKESVMVGKIIGKDEKAINKMFKKFYTQAGELKNVEFPECLFKTKEDYL